MADLSPLLAARWSPRSFDSAVDLTDAQVASLLEAARWAPSAENGQPWRFLLGRRADEAYKRIFVHLRGNDQRWAGRAAALLLGAYRPDGPTAGAAGPSAAEAARRPAGESAWPVAGPSHQAAYDLGQAVAHLTVQAGALGLHVHQMYDFDRAGLAVDLELPGDVRPQVVVAVGQLGDPRTLPEDLRRRETELRRRLPLTELLLG